MMPRAASRACVRFDRLSQFVMLDAFAWRDASTSSAVHESCRDTVHDATVGRMDRLLDATHELPAPESRYSAARSFGARRPAHGVPSLTMASESRRRPSPKSASPRSRCRPRTRRLGGADDVVMPSATCSNSASSSRKAPERTKYGTTADRSRRVGPVGAGIAGFLCTADQGTVQVPVPAVPAAAG